MWGIENQTKFAGERAFVRDKDGAEVFVAAVRATFDIAPDGSISVAAKQEPVAMAPLFLGAPGESSLRCDSDLHRTKLGTDVLINGSAYAPDGRRANEVLVGMEVGTLRKSLIVRGDRVWEKSLLGPWAPSRPLPFDKLPIVYERAYGGPLGPKPTERQMRIADQNPVGVGLKVEEGAPIPNVEYLDETFRAAGSPAGFGAICCAWMPRRSLAGTYDDAWHTLRQPLEPLDFRDEFFYAAPEDQRVSGYLRGGETVKLLNMTPSGVLAFRLPRLSFGFRSVIGPKAVHHRGVLHTVLIEPDANRLTMVWHSALPCHHEVYALNRVIVWEKKYSERAE